MAQDRPEPLPLNYGNPPDDAKALPVNFWVRIAIFLGVTIMLVWTCRRGGWF